MRKEILRQSLIERGIDPADDPIPGVNATAEGGKAIEQGK